MTTAATRRTARPSVKPAAPAAPTPDVEKAVELTAGERLAADLRVLAEISEKTPAVAADLASALREVTVVLRVNSPAVDVLVAALAEKTIAEDPSVATDEVFFSKRSWPLPNRMVTLSAGLLDVSVDDIEAAGR